MSQERILKLLDSAWSGLPTGLTEGHGDSGLAVLGIVAQSLAAEARTLAAPVSYDVSSSTHAEGIEDRMTSAPLGARRLAEMVALSHRLLAIEAVVAAQAIDLRAAPLGVRTRASMEAIRAIVPFMTENDPVPTQWEEVGDLIRSPRFTAEDR